MHLFKLFVMWLKDANRFILDKKIWIFPLCLVLCLATSVSVFFFTEPPLYQTHETVAIINVPGEKESRIDVFKGNRHLAELYAESIRNADLAKTFLSENKIALEKEVFLQRLKAVNDEDTVLVTVSLYGEDKNRLQQQLSLYLTAYNEFIDDVLNIQEIRILHEPTVPTPYVNLAKPLLWGGVSGLLLGLAVFLLVLFGRRRIESQEQLATFSKPIFGVIPTAPANKEVKKRD